MPYATQLQQHFTVTSKEYLFTTHRPCAAEQRNVNKLLSALYNHRTQKQRLTKTCGKDFSWSRTTRRALASGRW